MKLKILMAITLMLLVCPFAAAVVVWDPAPTWNSGGTTKTIDRGQSATFKSGYFWSVNNINYRVRLVRGSSYETVVNTDVSSATTTQKTTTISPSDYNSIWCGSTSCTYTVQVRLNDGDEIETETLTLTVIDDEEPVVENQEPYFTYVPSNPEYDEEEFVSFTLQAHDPDASDSLLDFSVVSGLPAGASLSSDGVFTWNTDYEDAGNYYITFRVDDQDGGHDTESTTLRIMDVNRDPVFTQIIPQHVDEDEELLFTVSASDPDGDSIMYTALSLPAGASFDGDTREFTWTPTMSQAGTYTATFAAQDYTLMYVFGTGWVPMLKGGYDEMDVSITVHDVEPGNNCPVLNSIGDKVIDENTQLTFAVSVTDVDGDTLTYSAVPLPAGASFLNRVFDWTPNSFQTGTHDVTFTVSDGVCEDSETITITVNEVDMCEVDLNAVGTQIGYEGSEISFQLSASGTDDITFSSPAIPVGASLNANTGLFSWTPGFGDAGDYTVTFNAHSDFDGGCDDTITVQIQVLDENRCPVFDTIDDQTVTVGNTLEFNIHAEDADGDTVVYSADLPFNTMLDEASGDFSWTPVALQVGEHIATFYASDGQCQDTGSISIFVIAEPNDAPTADFDWTPDEPALGDEVTFWSTSTDPDGDDMTCHWVIGETTYDECDFTHVFDEPGDHDVTLTVTDEHGASDSVTQTITVTGELTVTGITCLDPVVQSIPEDNKYNWQSCTIEVEGTNGAVVSGANVVLHYSDTEEEIMNCVTNSITGNCMLTFTVPETPGEYTVYATAEKEGWISDLDQVPTETFEVLEQRYYVSNLAVYNDPEFTHEDYDFFRGEYMYVKFLVLDEFYQPAENMVTSVALVSPPGGMVYFDEFVYDEGIGGMYYYDLAIPTTHDFLGDSQVFTFAFNFTDGSGAQQVVEVVIRNNPPVIDSAVVDEFDMVFDETTSIDLTSYGSDIEDSGYDLVWSVMGVDESVALVSVDEEDVLTVVPVSNGHDVVTLILTDLDGDSDLIDVAINTEGVFIPECSDGLDNDGDGLVDLDDPDCASSTDDNESGTSGIPECADGLDNDGDGLIDLADPDCSDSSDDSEDEDPYVPACNDGLDNDGDGLIDMDDPGCLAPADDDEYDYVALTQCNDGIDNDGDGFIDLDDMGCENAADDDEENPVTYPVCSDGVDNDGDGLIDYPQDPGCESAGDSDEYNEVVVTECSDGLDNDGDGLVDLDDPDCTDLNDDNEHSSSLPECSDGIDNDGDGFIDYPADSDCVSSDDDSEHSLVLPECNDGIDNDGDGEIDYPEDHSCHSLNDNTEGSPAQCADGADNDGDGFIDFPEDPNCENAADNSEAGALPLCMDGLDNDFDGLIDILDPGCDSIYDDDEWNADIPDCSDGIDNDGDGLVDFPEDPGCVSEGDVSEYNEPEFKSQCEDGIDNDGDGLVDMYDPGCESPDDNDEWNDPNLPACSDGLDNDGDGLIDMADPDCIDSGDDSEQHIVTQCNDGLDNDGDGFVDLADPHCWNMDDPYEGEMIIPDEPYVFLDQDDLLVTRITLNGYDVETALVAPGNYVRFVVGVENTLDYDLEDVKLQVSIDELALRGTDKIGDLNSDESETARVMLDIPSYVEPGLYDVRVVVSNDDIRRVKYRHLLIV